MTEQQRNWLRDFIGSTQERLDTLEATVVEQAEQIEALQKQPPAAKSWTRKKQSLKFTDEELTDARTVLNKINEHAGTALRFASSGGYTRHVEVIVSRLRKGATAHDMRLIAWHKCPEFVAEDGLGHGFCKPSTLFINAHFDDYLDAARLAFDQAGGDGSEHPTAKVIQEYAETGFEDGSNPMDECHAAIALIKAGMQVHVSRECMSEYGANIKKHRELVAKARGDKGNPGSV